MLSLRRDSRVRPQEPGSGEAGTASASALNHRLFKLSRNRDPWPGPLGGTFSGTKLSLGGPAGAEDGEEMALSGG